VFIEINCGSELAPGGVPTMMAEQTTKKQQATYCFQRSAAA